MNNRIRTANLFVELESFLQGFTNKVSHLLLCPKTINPLGSSPALSKMPPIN